MANPYDFEDPDWLLRKEELLRRADYRCAEDGGHEAKSVHVCYYVKGRKLWEFPDDAYKCYCPRDWEMRRNVEEGLKITLASFSISEIDVLNETLKHLAVARPTERARIIEQAFNEAKNKQREYDVSPESPDDEDEWGEDDEY